MEVLPERVAARRSNYETYVGALQELDGIQFLEEPMGYSSNRWLSCILTPSYEAREHLRLALQQEDIESRPLWKPMHMQPVFETARNFTDGTSEDLFLKGLCLPSGSNLSQSDLARVIAIIKKEVLK
jgi:dTDP-4-amino-4,6-dideoxygalactose transaminase